MIGILFLNMFFSHEIYRFGKLRFVGNQSFRFRAAKVLVFECDYLRGKTIDRNMEKLLICASFLYFLISPSNKMPIWPPNFRRTLKSLI